MKLSLNNKKQKVNNLSKGEDQPIIGLLLSEYKFGSFRKLTLLTDNVGAEILIINAK